MSETVLRIVVCLATAPLFLAMAYKLFGVMTQSGYQNEKFFAWLKRKDNLFFNRLALLSGLMLLSVAVVSLAFSFLGENTARTISALPFFLFLILFVGADRKYALKVPVKATARVKRLAAVFILVSLVCSYLLLSVLCLLEKAVNKDLYTIFAYLPFCLTPTALPFLLMLANACISPCEKKRNEKFVKRMGQVLDETQITRIGVTGSYGKTSVKNILKTLLSEKFSVVCTPESYNTPIGVALTVKNEELKNKQIFIAEMGARKKGDIKELCEMVKPDFGVLTGVCAQHIQTFESLNEIISEKSELISSCKNPVVCGKEIFEKLGTTANAVPTENAENIALFADRTEFDFAVDGKTYYRVKTKLLGNAAVENIMLCVTLCLRLGMTGEEIARGVEKLEYIPHRLQLLTANGAYILDDGYNASEQSAKEAVAALKRFDGKKIIVTPGIVETGVLEEKINGKLGERLVGLDRVILVGDTLVGAVKNGYLSAGGDSEKLTVVPSLDDAKELLRSELLAGDCVLFLNDLPDIY